jgi:glycosyltransferase involved in cell wall biosynthesis
MRSYSNILPIIVLYKQSFKNAESIIVLDRLLTAESRTLDLFVYDNSPMAQHESSFKYNNFNVNYVHDPTNSGVSKAYNCGAVLAKNLGFKWILLLDQDTIFPDNFLKVYEDALVQHSEYKIFAPVLKTQFGQNLSPCLYYHKRGYWMKDILPGMMNVHKYSPVNSGMLINVDTFLEIGGYNEKVKLDFADFQFIERFQKKYSNFYVLPLECIQDFSGFEKNLPKLTHRFVFFCQGARNADRHNFADRWWYLVAVVRRMIGLIIRMRSLSFFIIFLDNYILPNNKNSI